MSAISGILGSSIAYTLSPRLHEHEADALGLRLSYVVIDTHELGPGGCSSGQLIQVAGQLGFVGLNVTYPHKAAAFEVVDARDTLAADLQSVNTVVYSGGRSIGYNTDAAGFGAGLDEVIGSISGSRVVQFGAGGAGSATAHAALSRGVDHLTIIDLDHPRADALAERMSLLHPQATVSAGEIPAQRKMVKEVDGIINATPVGSVNSPGSVVDADSLRPDHWVADIVYAPIATQLITDATAIGARTVNGGRMLVNQAAASFELFHGRVPDRARMWSHFLELVGVDSR